MSVSCWVSFWIVKAEKIFGSAIGLNIPGYPFEGQQALGALLGIVLVTLFAIRRHLKAVVQKTLLNRGIDDSREPLGYRGVLAVMVISGVLLSFFLPADGALTLGYREFLHRLFHDVCGVGADSRGDGDTGARDGSRLTAGFAHQVAGHSRFWPTESDGAFALCVVQRQQAKLSDAAPTGSL
jgi:hypothetical protein